METPFDQHGFSVRFGWGPEGLAALAPLVDVVVIVDVLSFATTVNVALSRGVVVYPYRWHDGTEVAYAESKDAHLALHRGKPGFSQSPMSFIDTEAGTRVVLPSPNGSALSYGAREAGAHKVLVGCLRNATATATAINTNESVAVIAGGERWQSDAGSLRPAIEDQVGAGAILAALQHDPSQFSPEARIAAATFRAVSDEIEQVLLDSASGRELTAIGFEQDVRLAAEVDVSTVVPQLDGDCFA